MISFALFVEIRSVKDAFFWPTNVNKKEADSDVTTNQRVRKVQVADSQPTAELGWQ